MLKKNTKSVFLDIILIILFAFLLVSPQVYKHALIVSNDWIFHMNRFYETAMQIKNGIFNYFQSIYAFNQSGRVVNAMYGTDFSYINGFLLLLLGNWFRFEVVSNFLCFFTSGLSMYALAKYCGLTRKFSIAASLLYMGTPTIVYYTVAQNFSGWGAAFLPLAFIPAVRMVNNKENPINPILLALVISLLLSVHMFSTVLAVLGLIPFFCVSFFNSKKKFKLLLSAFLSVFLCIGLSFNTFSAIYDLSSDTLISPYSVINMAGNSTFLSTGSMGWANFGMMYSLIFVFQIIFSIVNRKKLSKLERIINYVGLFFLVVSSRYIPWNDIGNALPLIRKIQFPQRFGCIACILLIVGFCLALQNITSHGIVKERTTIVKVLALTISVVSLTGGYLLVSEASDTWSGNQPLSKDSAAAESLITDANEIRRVFGGNSELGDALAVYRKPTSDYLPVYSDDVIDSYKEYQLDIFNNKLDVDKKVTENGKLSFTFHSEGNDKVTLPVIVYSRSTVSLNGKELSDNEYDLSKIGALKITPDKGANEVSVGYKPSKLFSYSFVIRLLFFMGIIIYSVIFISKRRIKNN